MFTILLTLNIYIFKYNNIFKNAVKKLGIKAEVGHVYDVNKIIEYGVMLTPAVAINEKIKIQGKIPAIEEVEKIIKEELSHKQK